VRCPDCSGDCEEEVYPEDEEGKEYKYSTAYRLAKHIKEVHFNGLKIAGQDMTGKSCVPRGMEEFDPAREITLSDPRRKGQARKSGVLGEGREIDFTETFKYLGVMVSNDGNFDDEVKHRIRESWKAFASLKPLLVTRRLKRSTKVGVWKTYVMSSLLSGAATWVTSEEQEEELEVAMHKQLRSLLLEKKYKDEEGNTRTPSRDRIRQVAQISAIPEILRERRLHLRRSIMCMKGALVKSLLKESWWSGHASPIIPLEEIDIEEDKAIVVEHLVENIREIGGTSSRQQWLRLSKEEVTDKLGEYCSKYKSVREILAVANIVHQGEDVFMRKVQKLVREEHLQRITRPDWGLQTARDMVVCGLVNSDAEVMTKWESKCVAYKRNLSIPYIDNPPHEEIQNLMTYKIAWTDGALGENNVAAFAVVEGRWDNNSKRVITQTCDYNAVVRPYTNNRGEISGVLKALQRSRREPLMLVIDSEIAIRSCLGHIIKNNNDLCDIVMAEIRARTEPLALVKIWSHPESKKKPITKLNVGNEMADVLAGYATSLPTDERPEKLCEIFSKAPREVSSARRGTVLCYRAEEISSHVRKQRHFGKAEEVFNIVGNRGRPK